jgi:membrane fusion protein (multidrug efflux system)
MRLRFSATVLAATLLSGVSAADAQMGGPPTVGVTKAALSPIYKTSQYVGRVEAINHITLQARVTGFLQQRNFTEGSMVKKGQVLFVIEQPPYQAAVLSAQGAVSQAQAQLRNSQLTLGRSRTLLNTPAGQQSTVDTAVASAGSNQGQLLTAEAQLQQAEINLGYTTIASPIDGALAKIVSQDPEYITFPVSESEASQLEDEYAGHGGLASLTVKVQLPDGHMYDQTGKIDFTDISVSSSTDTLTLRATVPNPERGAEGATEGNRTLVDGGFVTVILQSQSPQQEVTIPRAAVLADQQGNYVYVVGADSKVSRQNIAIGDADGVLAVVTSGLKAGDTVVADGVQRVKPGAAVKTVPYTPPNYGDGAGTNG